MAIINKKLIFQLQNDTLTPPEREILNKVNLRLSSLKNAMLAIDDTLFLLQMFVYYNTAK